MLYSCIWVWSENQAFDWLEKQAELQWTLVTTTAFVPKDIAIKTNLLLYRILNEQIDM